MVSLSATSMVSCMWQAKIFLHTETHCRCRHRGIQGDCGISKSNHAVLSFLSYTFVCYNSTLPSLNGNDYSIVMPFAGIRNENVVSLLRVETMKSPFMVAVGIGHAVGHDHEAVGDYGIKKKAVRTSFYRHSGSCSYMQINWLLMF